MVGVEVLNGFQSGLEYLTFLGVMRIEEAEMYRSTVVGIAEPLWELLDSLSLVCYNGTSLVYHTDVYNKTSDSEDIKSDVVNIVHVLTKVVREVVPIFIDVEIPECPLDFVNMIGVEVLNQIQSVLEYLTFLSIMPFEEAEMYRSILLGIADPLWQILDAATLVCYNGTSLEYHTKVYKEKSDDIGNGILYVLRQVFSTLTDLAQLIDFSFEDCPLDFVNMYGVEVLKNFQYGLEYLLWADVLSSQFVEVSLLLTLLNLINFCLSYTMTSTLSKNVIRISHSFLWFAPASRLSKD